MHAVQGGINFRLWPARIELVFDVRQRLEIVRCDGAVHDFRLCLVAQGQRQSSIIDFEIVGDRGVDVLRAQRRRID